MIKLNEIVQTSCLEIVKNREDDGLKFKQTEYTYQVDHPVGEYRFQIDTSLYPQKIMIVFFDCKTALINSVVESLLNAFENEGISTVIDCEADFTAITLVESKFIVPTSEEKLFDLQKRISEIGSMNLSAKAKTDRVEKYNDGIHMYNHWKRKSEKKEEKAKVQIQEYDEMTLKDLKIEELESVLGVMIAGLQRLDGVAKANNLSYVNFKIDNILSEVAEIKKNSKV